MEPEGRATRLNVARGLVDGETERVHEVEFPLASHQPAGREHRPELIAALIVLAAVLLVLVLY